MPTAQKERVIEATKELYEKSIGVVFTDYRGLRVKEMQQLRNQLRAKGGELHVVKNTLFRRAAGELAETLPYEMHNGPTAIAFLFENESAGAKVLVDFAKSSKTLIVKGGFIGGKTYDAKGVEALSKLPTRDVLLSQLIGVIAAPMSNLVGVIEALYADPIRTIGAVADKAAEGSPVPASEATAPAESAPAEPVAEASSDESAPTEARAEASETPAEAASEEPSTESPAEEPTTSEAPAEEAEPTTESAPEAADSSEEPAS